MRKTRVRIKTLFHPLTSRTPRNRPPPRVLSNRPSPYRSSQRVSMGEGVGVGDVLAVKCEGNCSRSRGVVVVVVMLKYTVIYVLFLLPFLPFPPFFIPFLPANPPSLPSFPPFSLLPFFLPFLPANPAFLPSFLPSILPIHPSLLIY